MRRIRRLIWSGGLIAAVAVGLVASGTGSAGTQASSPGITDYVKYIHGKAGPANKSLSVVKIGWVNNQGGSIIPVGPSATDAAQFTVNWINKYGGGIGGHPLKLETCFVKNAEEEGLKCGQKFLNDADIHVVAYGAVATGANTINSTIAGKKPIVMGFSLNASDVTNPNTYILFVAGNVSVYGWGTFGQKVLKAKTATVVYPQGTGFQEVAAGVKEASEAAGIKTTLVGFNPQSTDLTGALTAAGAQKADMIAPIVASPGNCIAVAKGLDELNVDPRKVVGFLDCTTPNLKKSYPGGDFPKWWYGIAQSGDALVNNASGRAFRKALGQFGLASHARDAWYSGMFSSVLTLAQFMNEIGVDNLSPQAIAAKAKAFKGPLVLGEPIVQCGKYPTLPAVCGDGDQFFRYLGNGKFQRYPTWIQTPVELQKKLHARPRKGG